MVWLWCTHIKPVKSGNWMSLSFNSSGSGPLTSESDVYFTDWNQHFKSGPSEGGRSPCAVAPVARHPVSGTFLSCSQDVAWPEDRRSELGPSCTHTLGPYPPPPHPWSSERFAEIPAGVWGDTGGLFLLNPAASPPLLPAACPSWAPHAQPSKEKGSPRPHPLGEGLHLPCPPREGPAAAAPAPPLVPWGGATALEASVLMLELCH